MQKQSLSQSFRTFIYLKTKKKYQLKRSWALLEPFCKTKFRQLCINYRGSYQWNTIMLSQNTDLEQSITLKILKEKLLAYLFTRDDVTFLF